MTTNWIVLDNRADTANGLNMTDGIDRYRLSGGNLILRSAWGIQQRNASASLELSGGRVAIDNIVAATNLTVLLDANIQSAGTTTLDTV
ncbi:hypothetical protein LAJ55_13465, partial [Streptococcus pneumoniae]|uniref:hypothetical protein n=1 Tax=Streptococcus pneumoniae TaxID=1313 RepID=UPI001CBD570B